MRRLRDPERGCPWDREQDFASIAPYTVEEAYEVADAIARGAFDELRDELGDLLLQVVFHAQIAQERGLFDFDAVAAAITAKLIRRHPHVFGDTSYADAAEQHAAWETIKAAERGRRSSEREPSLLDDVPLALPALIRAAKLQRRAARAGFDWSGPEGVLAKLAEELSELQAARAGGIGAELVDEVGDLLFTCVNLARHLGVDPEQALTDGNRKFERRFRAIEALARAQGRPIEACSRDDQERLWEQVKADPAAAPTAPSRRS